MATCVTTYSRLTEQVTKTAGGGGESTKLFGHLGTKVYDSCLDKAIVQMLSCRAKIASQMPSERNTSIHVTKEKTWTVHFHFKRLLPCVWEDYYHDCRSAANLDP